jgi:hypothetical protein
MDQNFQSLKLPTVGASSAIGGASAWSNPSRITADDGSSASWGAFAGAQQSLITGSTFGFQQLPDSAVIDGIEVYIDGSQTGCYGDVTISPSGTTGKDIGAMNGSYGGPNDLWGASEITLSDIASISVSVEANDVSGGDGIASIDYISITVFWHIEVESVPADVPTRIDYKVYSRDGNYLGLLPNVTSKLGFPQDINSAGSSIDITCGQFVKNEITVSPLLDESGNIITTEDDLPILTTSTDLLVTTGDSPDEAIFKNSNRIRAWLYNQYYPNGKLVFSGQVNRVAFQYGGDASVKLTVYSDSQDMNNFIARGYPFSYTNDASQTSQNGYATCSQGSKSPEWVRYGQTWVSGASATNIGAISLMLQGTATVTLSIYDAPNGNLIGSVTRSVNNGAAAVVSFEFASLIPISSNTSYFWAVSVASGQSIRIYRTTSDLYVNGTRYESIYAGGSGGGLYSAITGDFYFVTKYGTPTTTTTFTSDDPVSEMAHNALLDYNARGGLVTERDFDATGLSLTYTFVVATIYELIKKVLELSPTGYYSYIDLGTAEIDIKQVSDVADYTVVRGRHINQLNINMSIEQVKNYLLFTGGPTAGVNLFRDYQDSESISNYGIRTLAKTDNRVTLSATADAIGDSFTEENSDEIQETTLTVLNDHMDISLLTPGKTIGFRNFGNFIDDMVLQIVRREVNFSDGIVNLTLGRLPIRMSDEIQKINRGLLNEQTINNPSAPS